jgi:hypothetical protein
MQFMKYYCIWDGSSERTRDENSVKFHYECISALFFYSSFQRRSILRTKQEIHDTVLTYYSKQILRKNKVGSLYLSYFIVVKLEISIDLRKELKIFARVRLQTSIPRFACSVR